MAYEFYLNKAVIFQDKKKRGKKGRELGLGSTGQLTEMIHRETRYRQQSLNRAENPDKN